METDSTNADSLSASRDMSTPYNRDYYLKDLPKTEEDFKNSDSLIVEAYHKLGELYKESLRDTAAALKIYGEFMERFPNNKYELESWFALYQLYNGQGDVSNGAKYKSLILANYPESDYAKVIVDPTSPKETIVCQLGVVSSPAWAKMDEASSRSDLRRHASLTPPSSPPWRQFVPELAQLSSRE